MIHCRGNHCCCYPVGTARRRTFKHGGVRARSGTVSTRKEWLTCSRLLVLGETVSALYRVSSLRKLVQLRLQACACNKPKMHCKSSSNSNSSNMASLQPTYKLQRYRTQSS